MAKYKVEVEYVKVLSRTVEAENDEEAYDKGQEEWQNGEHFDEEDVDSKIEFLVYKVEEE